MLPSFLARRSRERELLSLKLKKNKDCSQSRGWRWRVLYAANLVAIYIALVRSVIEYCVVWHNALPAYRSSE